MEDLEELRQRVEGIMSSNMKLSPRGTAEMQLEIFELKEALHRSETERELMETSLRAEIAGLRHELARLREGSPLANLGTVLGPEFTMSLSRAAAESAEAVLARISLPAEPATSSDAAAYQSPRRRSPDRSPPAHGSRAAVSMSAASMSGRSSLPPRSPRPAHSPEKKPASPSGSPDPTVSKARAMIRAVAAQQQRNFDANEFSSGHNVSTSYSGTDGGDEARTGGAGQPGALLAPDPGNDGYLTVFGSVGGARLAHRFADPAVHLSPSSSPVSPYAKSTDARVHPRVITRNRPKPTPAEAGDLTAPSPTRTPTRRLL